MSDTETTINNRMYYGLGMRSEDSGFELLPEDATPESLKEGFEPCVALELPTKIAYEIAYSLSMFGKTLHEYAVNDTPENEETALVVARSKFLLEMARMIDEMARKGLALTGEAQDWPEIDTSPEFTAEDDESDPSEA
jgi:hypothetical protein